MARCTANPTLEMQQSKAVAENTTNRRYIYVPDPKKSVGMKAKKSFKEFQEWLSEQECSDKVLGNLCIFACNVCGKEFKTLRVLYQHKLKTCRQDENVRASFPHAKECGVKIVAHRCQLCSQMVLCEHTKLYSHFKSHGMLVREYCRVSNCQLVTSGSKRMPKRPVAWTKQQEWLSTLETSQKVLGNLCIFLCDVCGKECRGVEYLKKHKEKEGHKSELKIGNLEVMKAHSIKILSHKCHLCSSWILCDTRYLSKHFKTCHGMTLQKYCNITQSKLVTSNPTSSQAWEDVKANSVRTSNIGNSCRFVCNYCDIRFTNWPTTKEHVNIRHKDTLDSLLAKEGGKLNAIDFLSKSVLYECQICQALVLCDRVFIRNHLKKVHDRDISLAEITHSKGSAKTSFTRTSADTKFKSNSALQRVLSNSVTSNQVVGSFVTYACHDCTEVFQAVNTFKKHLKTSNHMTSVKPQDVVAKCHLRILSHQCHLCSKLLLCEKMYIGAHLQGTHRIGSISDYCTQTGCLLVTKKGFVSDVWEKLLKKSKVTSEIMNKCRYKCFYCIAWYISWRSMQEHLKESHDGKRIPGIVKFVKKHEAFLCGLCPVKVLCDLSFINEHLYDNHNLASEEEYHRKVKIAKQREENLTKHQHICEEDTAIKPSMLSSESEESDLE